MNKYPDHGYTISKLLNYGVNKSLTSKQDFANLMTQHKPKGIYSVDYTRSLNLGMSLELLSATSTKFFGY